MQLDVRERATWALCGALAVIFAVSGAAKLLSLEGAVASFESWGYSLPFRFFVGFCEVLGAIGLLLPRLSASASGGLAAILLGAVYTHAIHGESPLFALAVLAGVLAVARLRWREAFFTWTPAPASQALLSRRTHRREAPPERSS